MTPAALFSAHWLDAEEVVVFGDGHINDSYLVRAGAERYVLQKINRRVFVDPAQVMRNTERVLDHCRGRVPLAELVRTKDRRTHVDVSGEVWRVWRHLPGRSLSALQNVTQARCVGDAYGAFQSCLDNLPGSRLTDPIAGFMQLRSYLSAYDAVCGHDHPLAVVVDSLRSLADRFASPNRHIHGDCKVNNVLFDERDTVAAVLDLDTAMWGHWAWDFGDLARSACAQNSRFDTGLFRALLEGFVPHAPEHDVDALVLSPCYVAGMLGVRFLTDHLQGDIYFKVSRRGDNLARAEAQFALLESMRSQEVQMRALAIEILEGE